jgi:hypothetical protein
MGVLSALVFALCTALLLAAAAPASALSRKQAGKKAVAALGASKSDDAVIVFGLPKSLSPGTRVTQEGKKKVLGKAGRGRAFFFYEDGAPFEAFPHLGRVALVDVKTGKVKLSKAITRRPLLNGKLPAFLKSARAYRDKKYVEYEDDADTPVETPPAAAAQQPPPFALEVPAVNQPPVANDQLVVAKQNSPRNILLTGSDPDSTDSDTGGDVLTFEVTKLPNHGTLSGSPPTLTYTPDPGRIGPDHFFFTVNDGELDSKEGKVTINVGPLGLPPSVTTSAGCTTYAELTPAVPVDDALTVADPDDPVLDSAVVRISNNFEGGDELGFTDQSGITGAYDDRTGTLTLTGAATVADYQAALRTVRYRNLSNGTPAGSKDVEFTVNDAGNDSAPAVKQVCITEVGGPNDRPIGEPGTEGAVNYIENDGPLPVVAAFIVVDDDSTHLSGATIKFVESQPPEDDEGNPIGDPVNNFAPAEDELAFTDQSGISGSYDDTLGVLTLSGNATVAEYEAAIRSVTYENSSEDPSDAPRALRFQVTDSSGLSSVPSSRGIFVTPVNDAPEVTTSEGTASYTENDPATPVDADLSSIDVDDDDLEGAQVRISSGLQAGDDLVFVDQLGISGVYNTGTGVLTLTGTASVADYQTALRSIEFSHTGDDPDPSRTVEYVTNDGELDSAPATRDIAVTAVNDKPVLVASDGSASFTEGDSPVVVDAGIAASDVDSDTFVGATVSVSANFVSGDTLAFVEQGGITGTFDSESGILTLAGTASVADYEAVLRSVTFGTSSDNPTDATRTVSFQVDDGGDVENLSDAVTRDVTVTPVNDAPAVNTSDGSTEFEIGGDAVQVDASLTVSDADDVNLDSAQVSIGGFEAGDELIFVDQLGISGVYNTGTGVLTLTTDPGGVPVDDWQTALSSIEFDTSNEAASATRTVDFKVNDGELDSATSSKAIDLVVPVNEAPFVATSETPSTYVIDGNPVAVDPGVSVTDADDTDLESATVAITTNFEAGDELGLPDQPGITDDFDETTGILTLTGTASVAAYEAALRLVEFRTSNAAPSATRTIRFTANDGELDSAAADQTVLVVAPDPPPEL